MKNEYRYNRQLHPFLETMGLIYLSWNFAAVREDAIQGLNELNIDGERFYDMHLSYLEGYVKEFEKKYEKRPEDEFFFSGNTEFFLTVAAIAIELLEAGKSSSPDKQSLLDMIGEFLSEESGEVACAPDSLEGWVELLQSSGYEEETKWKLLQLVGNPEEKFRAFFALYEKNRQAFEYAVKKNDGVLKKLVSEAPAELSDAMDELVCQLHPGHLNVYLTAVFPLIEWMMSGTVFQGVLVNRLHFHKKGMDDVAAMLPQVLKLLGDKSKFEILCLLKKGGKYNLEIAEELNLTPATASHHMGLLLSNHMVTVEKKDGRVYYRLNSKTVEEIAEGLRQVFL